MTSVYVVLRVGSALTRVCTGSGITSIRCPLRVAICSSMLYDVSRQGEQYSMYM